MSGQPQEGSTHSGWPATSDKRSEHSATKQKQNMHARQAKNEQLTGGSVQRMRVLLMKAGFVQSSPPILIVTAQPVVSKSQKLSPMRVRRVLPAVGQPVVAAPESLQPDTPSTRGPLLG